MHRLINKTTEGFDTDHINRNKLDNRRSNLRTVTRSQNQFNRSNPLNNTSGVKGVHCDKNWKKWKVGIRVNGRSIYLGRYNHLQGAFLARRWGERAYI